MDIKIKDSINHFFNQLSYFIVCLFQTIVSVLRVLVLSSLKTAFRSRQYKQMRHSDDCVILLNGPSLKEALAYNEVHLDGKDVFCVNSFCESEYFWTIKPRFYCIIDGAFFNPTDERCINLVNRVIECLRRVDWEMKLFVPSFATYGDLITTLNNKHIEIVGFNTASVKGYEWFTNLMCRYNMGMHACINVGIFSIMSALVMRYKSLYIYGMDHTFSAQLFVDDDNCVCSRENHVYSAEPKVIKLPESTMYGEMSCIALCFCTHSKVQRYSKYLGAQIYNCTKGSFVDAYKRLKFQEIKAR